MTTLQRIRAVLKSNEEYFRSFGFTEIGVFGSYVRGEETPESDVDILLGGDSQEINGNKKGGLAFFAMYGKLSDELDNVEVDIAIKHQLYPRLRDNILGEVEYIVAPPEVMAHNARREVGAKLEKDNTVVLHHMIKEMQVGMKNVADMTFETFKNDEDKIRVAFWCITVLGEAANRVSSSLKEKYAHLEIPWRDMADMRNKLVHEYDHILLPKVWDTLVGDIPKALPEIQEMCEAEEKLLQQRRAGRDNKQ